MAKKILIVEDNLAIAENLFDFLEMAGYEPCGIARSYDEAVSILNESHPDFALLDVNLIGDLTGIDVAAFINENLSIPFVYFSAAVEPNVLRLAQATRPFAFVPKPIEFSNLKVTIDAALEEDLNRNMLQISILNKIAYLIAPPVIA